MTEDPIKNRVNLAYWFYGNEPGKPLTSFEDFRKVKHTRANAMGEKVFRTNTFRVNRGRFDRLKGIEELSDRLFGAVPVKETSTDSIGNV